MQETERFDFSYRRVQLRLPCHREGSPSPSDPRARRGHRQHIRCRPSHIPNMNMLLTSCLVLSFRADASAARFDRRILQARDGQVEGAAREVERGRTSVVVSYVRNPEPRVNPLFTLHNARRLRLVSERCEEKGGIRRPHGYRNFDLFIRQSSSGLAGVWSERLGACIVCSQFALGKRRGCYGVPDTRTIQCNTPQM